MPGRNDPCPCGSERKYKKCCLVGMPDREPHRGKKDISKSVDLELFSESELIALNQKIVARLRMLREVRAHKSMVQFRIGERVVFERQDGPPVVGILTRFNRKSVTVISEDGVHWNVSPELLRSVSDNVVQNQLGALRLIPISRT